MADMLTLDILTPTGRVQLAQGEDKDASVEVPGVEVPGFLGELGILPGHIPFVTPVRPGIVRFKDAEASRRIAVGTGFLEVSEAGRVSIMTQQAVVADDVDGAAVQKELDEVRSKLGQLADYALASAEHRGLLEQEAWLSAQLRLVG